MNRTTLRFAVPFAVAATLSAALAGCPGSTSPPDASDATTEDFEWHAIPGASCNARQRRVPVLDSPHIAEDAGAPAYNSNPPSSGPHIGYWARWGVAQNPVPRGVYVHNLEHGGVVFAFRCPDAACAAREQLRAAVAMMPPDPLCVGAMNASPQRALVTQDNAIDRTIAAAAWGHVYEADCVDAASLRAFYTAHVARGPENTCAEGFGP